MPHLPRLLAPICAATAMAAFAPAAHAATSLTFPEGGPTDTTVEITDAGPSSDTVHLTVTVADPADLDDTKVFLGGDGTTPYHAVSVDGVRDARYADEADGELSTGDCLVYAGSLVIDSAPVTVSPEGDSFSADLPKGEVIAFESTGVAVGVAGQDTACERFGFSGLDVDYVDTHRDIDGFSWAVPAAPVVTQASGGRRAVSLTFARRLGTTYDIYKVGESEPFRANLRGAGDAVRIDLTESDDGEQLVPGTSYAFQVRATRSFSWWNVDRDDLVDLAGSPLSAVVTVSTAAAHTLAFTAVPASSTTLRNATFAWTMPGNGAGEAPYCVLDLTENGGGTPVPCTATGASVTDLSVGAHRLNVFTADGENAYSHEWTVTAPPAPAAAVIAPVAPAVPALPAVAKPKAAKNDPDGDGIKNTWLVNGKPAAAPAAPKATLVGGKVRLKLGKAPAGAKQIRVYRADGKSRFKLVKALKASAKEFRDRSVRRGHSYAYKLVAVNAKGQQGKGSKAAVAKLK